MEPRMGISNGVVWFFAGVAALRLHGREFRRGTLLVRAVRTSICEQGTEKSLFSTILTI